MHFLAFAFKRAHYASLKLGRPFAQPFGLTPARVDFLYAVKRAAGAAWQATIARWLGVSAVTVSRMARSLEKLGLLVRERPSFRDKRKVRVKITRRGRKRLYGALLLLMKKPMQQAYEHALSTGPLTFATFLKVDDTYLRVWRIRAALGDGARSLYPNWHPES